MTLTDCRELAKQDKPEIPDMVRIIDGEIVPDDDPRVRNAARTGAPSSSQSQPGARGLQPPQPQQQAGPGFFDGYDLTKPPFK